MALTAANFIGFSCILVSHKYVSLTIADNFIQIPVYSMKTELRSQNIFPSFNSCVLTWEVILLLSCCWDSLSTRALLESHTPICWLFLLSRSYTSWGLCIVWCESKPIKNPVHTKNFAIPKTCQELSVASVFEKKWKGQITQSHETLPCFFLGHNQSCEDHIRQGQFCKVWLLWKVERRQNLRKGGKYKVDLWPNSKFCPAKSCVHTWKQICWCCRQYPKPVPVQIGPTKNLGKMWIPGW